MKWEVVCMRVLQINCVYGQGSTGKITKDIHMALLDNNIESYVCYGRGKDAKEKNVIRISTDLASRVRRFVATIDGMPYRFTSLTNSKVKNEIQRLKPDVVHLQCINGYFLDVYDLLKYLKQRHYATILTLHAEFMYTGGCGYALDCNKWINGCGKCNRLKSGLGVIGLDRVKRNYRLMFEALQDYCKLTVVGVSNWISDRARQSRIMRKCNIITIRNGIDTKNVFYPRGAEKIFEKYGFQERKKIVLSVVPNLDSDLKGGKVIIKLADIMDKNRYQFVVVGARGEFSNIPENVIVVPYTDSQTELAEIYSAADVFVMGSKMDNYPTVCIEANCCGTPVIGFDVGGVAETIYPSMGEVVPYGDIDKLKCKIEEWADRKQLIPAETIKNAMIRNSKERMTEDYLSLYSKMLSD
jgi:putative colanic acid biosynthesis glycosyltransferase